jgi:hypothetical protein
MKGMEIKMVASVDCGWMGAELRAKGMGGGVGVDVEKIGVEAVAIELLWTCCITDRGGIALIDVLANCLTFRLSPTFTVLRLHD